MEKIAQAFKSRYAAVSRGDGCWWWWGKGSHSMAQRPFLDSKTWTVYQVFFRGGDFTNGRHIRLACRQFIVRSPTHEFIKYEPQLPDKSPGKN